MIKKRILFFLLFIISLSGVKAQITPSMIADFKDKKRMTQWVDSVFSKMTLEEKIGQCFIITFDPENTTVNINKVKRLIANQKIGGLLFSKGDFTEQAKFTNMAQQESKVPLFISLDGEWGLSMRLEGTTRFPKNVMLGAIVDENLLYDYGKEVARQCKEMGIQMNFAPDIDVNSNPDNPVIGTRSFGDNPEKVANLGIAYARGLESMGVIAFGKHFPGHGDTKDDSHNTLPTVSGDRTKLNNIELYPFRKFVNAGISGVMVGHLSVPALDNTPNLPSSLSKPIITGVLKNEMSFSGLVITDALVMKGAGSSDICVKALLAGNDILLNPANPATEFTSIKNAVDEGRIPLSMIEEKCRKILQYKYITGLYNRKDIVLKGLGDRINTPDADLLNRKLNENAITLLKNNQGLLPLKELDKRRIAYVSVGEATQTRFQRSLLNYEKAPSYNVTPATTSSKIASILENLKGYDAVVIGIHSTKKSNMDFIQRLCSQNKVVLSFFISPYLLNDYAQCIKNAEAVQIAYENTPLAMDYAGQAVFGGIGFKGKFPVTIKGVFNYGMGLNTTQSRLKYSIPEEVGVKSNKLAIIRNIVQEGISAQAYPGCQVLVAKDGVIIYNEAFGYFDYAKTHEVTTDDVYDLASVTKATATLAAIMKVYDDKKVKVGDKLSAYVSILKSTDKEDITIREALFHQSGLTPFIPFYQSLIDKSSYSGPLMKAKRDYTYRLPVDEGMYANQDFKFYSNLVSTTQKQGFTLQVAKNFYVNQSFSDSILNAIARSTLKRSGSYLYSDLNFMLLKEVVENVSKISLDNFVQKNFFSRLGATQTTFQPLLHDIDMTIIAPTEDDEFLRKQLLVGYVHDEAAAFSGGVSGNAGLFSNANDVAKLLQMWLNNGKYGGETYLSEETCKFFTSTKSPQSRRGLGFDKPDVANPSKSPTCRSAGGHVYGHTGFTGTCFWVDPDNKLIYIFLSNRVYPHRWHKKLMSLDIRPRIQQAIYDAM